MTRYALAVLLMLSAMPVSAQSYTSNCTLAWDYGDESLIDGYRLYIDDVVAWEGANKTVACADVSMVAGLHTGYVTAYNAAGESAPSGAVTFLYVTAAPEAPDNLRIGKPN